jgi:hypothetical protein
MRLKPVITTVVNAIQTFSDHGVEYAIQTALPAPSLTECNPYSFHHFDLERHQESCRHVRRERHEERHLRQRSMRSIIHDIRNPERHQGMCSASVFNGIWSFVSGIVG